MAGDLLSLFCFSGIVLAMNLLKRFKALVEEQRTIIRRHNLLLKVKDAEIEQLKHSILAHQVAYIDLATAWRISLEIPEVDIRENLDALLRDLEDDVAQTQEYVV